jgi:hypothetical protein
LLFPGTSTQLLFTAINSEIPPTSTTKTIQRLFLGVEAPAVAPPDNSGTGIQFFPPLLIPASAWEAIPRTSNHLQDYNSWVHRNERIAFP